MAGRRKIVFLAVVFIAAAVCAAGLHPRVRRLLKREKPVIRLHDGQADSLHLNNAVASYIIENGYGYQTRIVMQTTYMMQTAMQENRIDVNLEARRQEWPKWFNEQIRAGNILSLGVIFEGSSQFFVVPKWVAEKYGIETVFDMREHWQIFKDPDSPSKGVFYNGPIGSGCDRINAAKLQAYGLIAYYNIVSPPSAAALEATLARHQDKHEPVFGFCWAPNAVMGAYEWYILKEPVYSDECWGAIMDALDNERIKTIDHACAFKTTPMEKIISRGLLTTAPDVVEMLKKMTVDRQTVNEIFAWMRHYRVRDWKKPALYFLREHEDQWKEWVTPAAYRKVTDALERAPGAAEHRKNKPAR